MFASIVPGVVSSFLAVSVAGAKARLPMFNESPFRVCPFPS